MDWIGVEMGFVCWEGSGRVAEVGGLAGGGMVESLWAWSLQNWGWWRVRWRMVDVIFFSFGIRDLQFGFDGAKPNVDLIYKNNWLFLLQPLQDHER